MSGQSTRHLLMIEPAEFYKNPETVETNDYQHDSPEDHASTLAKAVREFRAYRDSLIENGVIVTTVPGAKGCPDHVFPNWISTHAGRKMVVYPMLNPNRRREKTPEIMRMLSNMYDVELDLASFEGSGKALESTGSLCMDRVNKIVYAALSKRTDAELVRSWADHMGYEPVMFETASHTGKPVYHTDLVMFIGTEAVGICAPAILESDRDRVLGRLRETHDVIEFSMNQLQSFCGNSLEVLGHNDEHMLTMSAASARSLNPAQREKLGHYFTRIIEADISTLELYGGGSARCTLMELF